MPNGHSVEVESVVACLASLGGALEDMDIFYPVCFLHVCVEEPQTRGLSGVQRQEVRLIPMFPVNTRQRNNDGVRVMSDGEVLQALISDHVIRCQPGLQKRIGVETYSKFR